MLPDIDAIAWGSFEHAYGTAEDVPEMLRDMLDPAKASSALTTFSNTVNHQGWASDAAVPAVGWLVALLDRPEVPLAQLVRLLADLAVFGNHDSWVSARLGVDGSPELRGPIAAAAPRFRELLFSDDADVRAASALALATVRDAGAETLAALRLAAAKDRSAAARASALLALGVVGDPTDMAVADSALEGKKVPKTLAIAATGARVWLSGGSVADDDLVSLLDASVAGLKDKALPWSSGSLSKLAGDIAIGAIRSHVSAARVAGLLEVVDPKARNALIDALVADAFPEDMPEITSPTALNDAQRLALELAATRPFKADWTSDRYGDAGCPKQPEAIRVYLGLDPPRAMDTPVELDGARIPLWVALRQLLRRAVRGEGALSATLPPITAQIPAATAVQAMSEMLATNYHYPDIMVRVGPVTDFGANAPHVQQSAEWTGELVAEFLAPLAEAAREFAETTLGAEASRPSPTMRAAAPSLVVLSRLGRLDTKWDPVVAKCLARPPRDRCPRLVGEVLLALDTSRAARLFAELQPNVVAGVLIELESLASLDQQRVTLLRDALQ